MGSSPTATTPWAGRTRSSSPSSAGGVAMLVVFCVIETLGGSTDVPSAVVQDQGVRGRQRRQPACGRSAVAASCSSSSSGCRESGCRCTDTASRPRRCGRDYMVLLTVGSLDVGPIPVSSRTGSGQALASAGMVLFGRELLRLEVLPVDFLPTFGSRSWFARTRRIDGPVQLPNRAQVDEQPAPPTSGSRRRMRDLPRTPAMVLSIGCSQASMSLAWAASPSRHTCTQA